MKRFDLVAFDIDGTLTESKQAIAPEMAELLSKLLEQYKVAIISGAAYKQFEWQVLSNLHCDGLLFAKLYLLPVDGIVICSYRNGWRCEEEELLAEVDKARIRSAFGEALEKTGFQNEGEIYGERIEDRGSQMNFSALGQDAPAELKKVWDPGNSKRSRIVAELKKLLPEFSFRIGGTTSIEATRKGVDKAYGLRKLSGLAGVPLDRMLFVGDKLFEGGNDAPALNLGMECRATSGPEETKKIVLELLEQS